MYAFPELTAAARAQLQGLIGTSTRGAQDLLDRFDRWGQDLIEAFAQLYPIETALPQLIEVMAAAHLHRDEELQQRDRERVLEQDWFQSEKTIGYVAYADLFAKNLKGINKRIPYLKDLGITYLHLLPILKPRPGANDGTQESRSRSISFSTTLRRNTSGLKKLDQVMPRIASTSMFIPTARSLTSMKRLSWKFSRTLLPGTSPGMTSCKAGCGRRLTPINGM